MDNKVFAVTGGASGIGLAVAKQLRAQGARLSIIDINKESLEAAAAQLGGVGDNLMTRVVNVREDNEVSNWVKATVEKFGRLDGAANMAGVIGKHHGVRELKDQDDEQWDLIFGVNVTGLMHCMRAEIRHMTRGSIVNASSIQGVRGFARHAAYSASKHAVVGLTRSVAREVAPNIRVNAIAPSVLFTCCLDSSLTVCRGVIATPLLDRAMETLGQSKEIETEAAITRNGEPQEVANFIVFLLSDVASFVTGGIHSCDGGWNC